VALAQHVRFNSAGRNAEFSMSNDGLLLYGTVDTAEYRLTWFGRDGESLATIGQPDAYETVRISPDGDHLAVWRQSSSGTQGIAVLEMSRGIATPLVSGFWGAWSPDSQRIAIGASPSGPPNVFIIPTSGQGERLRLTESRNSQTVLDWSSDGRFILFAEQPNDVATATKSGLWVLPLADRRPTLFIETAYRQAHAQFSPDGQWIAYTSTESGRAEIHVQSFPAGRANWQISTSGGDHPRWRPDGKELFYLAPDQTLMSAPVTRTRGTIDVGQPSPRFKIVFPAPHPGGLRDYPYDVSADGRVLGFTPAGDSRAEALVVISNWDAELTRPTAAGGAR
jgi:serine/threonine-protein kinase